MASAGVEISAAAIHQIIDTSEISEIQINGTTAVSWLVKLIGNVSSSKPQRCNGLAGAQLATQDPVYATTIDLMALRKSGSRVQLLLLVSEPDHLPRIPPPSGLFGMQAWRSVSFNEVLGMPQSPLLPGLTIWLWLGAARPIELVIEANDDRVEIGVYADRGNRVEIVVLAAEIVEVILDLGG